MLPYRNHPRLKEYDYSSAGCYYVTICTNQKRRILSDIVGRGLAPADTKDPCSVVLSSVGKTAAEQISAIEKRYPFAHVDCFVIMPDHIHMIITLDALSETAGASPRPTLTDIICSFKSVTTRLCNEAEGTPGRKLFQTSFYEHIIRNKRSYAEICGYILANPVRWYFGGK